MKIIITIDNADEALVDKFQTDAQLKEFGAKIEIVDIDEEKTEKRKKK